MDPLRRNTVGDAVRRAARLFRNRSALVFGDRDWSFNALDRAADRVAAHFAGLGLNAGDRIAAYGRNSDAYFIAWLACVRGGFVHVPVNYALIGEELSYIVGQSGSRLVLAGATLEGNLAGIEIPTGWLEDLIAVALD
ncbi:MAG: fatty-acyl-CoA synthase, partial [Acetobacteraceae bacterium]|nr:fatty-acyl-CoA synthase [Acetobacteraceae bacterium]